MKSIWQRPYTLNELSEIFKDTIVTHLGIEFTEIGQDYLKAKMPVDSRTFMPLKILHGGASCVLAETLASVGALLTVDINKKRTVGLEINANHLRPAAAGYVTGITHPLHIGKTTQVWEIKIYNEEDKLVCVSRVTMATPEA